MGRGHRRRRRERWQSTLTRVPLGAVLFMLVGPNDAAAEPVVPALEKLELEWSAPEECPTRAHVLAEITRMAPPRIGREVHARVAVERGASGDYHARVTMRVGSAFDQRDVQGAACAEIADASALLVALALAPEARPIDERFGIDPELRRCAVTNEVTILRPRRRNRRFLPPVGPDPYRGLCARPWELGCVGGVAVCCARTHL